MSVVESIECSCVVLMSLSQPSGAGGEDEDRDRLTTGILMTSRKEENDET